MRLFLVHGVDYLDDVVAGCVPGLGLEHDQHSGLLKDQCYCDKDKNVIIIKLNNFIHRIRKLMKKVERNGRWHKRRDKDSNLYGKPK